MGKSLSNILDPKKELSELQKLYSDTQKQIDDAVEDGNNALLDLKEEFEELAERKRELLRDIERLEGEFNKLKEKVKYTESTYGDYLDIIKGADKND